MNRGILITGGAHSIGKQICEDFLEMGDKVCFIDFNEQNPLEFEKYHPNLFYFYGDVSNPKSLQEFVSFSMEKMGRIDVLINNACKGNNGILSDLDYEGFDYVLSVRLKEPYKLSLLCKEELKKIMVILSILHLQGYFNQNQIVRHMQV